MSVPSPNPVVISTIRSIVGLNPAGSSNANPPSQPGVIKLTTAITATTIIADAVTDEDHNDEAVVTQNPVQVGAVVTDHMYKLPARLELIYSWSLGSPQNASRDPSFLKALYQQLLSFMIERVLCTVNTGKRLYQNMVVQRIVEHTDVEHENSMSLHLTMQEVIFAEVSLAPISSASVQAQPNKTAPVNQLGNQSLVIGTSTYNGGGSNP